MTSITLRDYGYTLTLKGLVNLEEVKGLTYQMRDEWAGEPEPFVWVLDARELTWFTADAQAMFEALLEEGLNRGLLRISVLAVTTALATLFCDMMVRADAMPVYQFLDVAYETNFHEELEQWVREPFSAQS